MKTKKCYCTPLAVAYHCEIKHSLLSRLSLKAGVEEDWIDGEEFEDWTSEWTTYN